MSDSTGGQRPDQPGEQQPPAYPPPTQQPGTPSTYGQPGEERRQSFTEMYGPPQSPYSQPAYAQPGYGQPAYGQPAYGAVPDRRPGTVTAAGVLTLIFSGLSAALALLILVAAVLVPADYIAGVRSSDPTMGEISDDQIVTGSIAITSVLAVWCVIAMILAVLALRRSNGARIGLVVSASLAAVVSLILILSLFSAVTLLASIAAIILLFTGGAGHWYAGKGGGSSNAGWQGSPVA